MGLGLLYKRGILTLGLILLAGCSKERVQQGLFNILADDMPGATKTLLSSEGIENRITSTVLAAYTNGKLYRTAYYSGNGSSLAFTLENGQTYSVYALVNTGDSRALFPEYESAIGSLTYRLTSYDSGTDCVNSRGIPMAGTATATGGDIAVSIRVKRLLAKVTATIHCNWPGATVTSGVVRNMNSVLKPFGSSAMISSADSFSFNPERQDCAPGSSSATMVFYVPENLQGAVAGIQTSAQKSHEHSAAVNSMKDCLTYLETTVSGSGLYDGEIVYRSYLGGNSTDNFDIVRNCTYTWDLTYTEDNLCHDEWKMDNSLDDRRTLSVPDALFFIPGENVRIGDFLDTNMPFESIKWLIGPRLSRADLVGALHNTSDVSGLSFTVDNSQSPFNYGNRRLFISPVSNPRTGLIGNTIIYVVDEQISWMNTLLGPVYNMVSGSQGNGYKYFVTPGKETNAEVAFSVLYNDDDAGEKVISTHLGKGGNRWTYTDQPYQGISGQLLGDVGEDHDHIRYSASSTVLPGDYPITAETMDGSYSNAFIHVNDTRTLSWANRSSAVPSASAGVIAYRLLSENKILLMLTNNCSFATLGGTGFNQNNSPFQFMASDRSSRVGNLPGNYAGVPFEGAALHSGNYSRKLDISYNGSLTTNGVYSPKIGNKTASGILTLVPRVTANLSGSVRHVITIKAKNGYDDNTSHAIEAVIRARNGEFSELALSPAISRVTVGSTVTLVPTLYYFRVVDDEIMEETATVISATNSSLVWTGASRGVFTATHPGNYRITATFRGSTAYADIEVTSSDIDVSGEWDNGGSIILD